MAISVNNVQTQAVAALGTTSTFASYVVGSTTDRVLVAVLSGEMVISATGWPSSGVTFGGVAMTKAVGSQVTFNGVEVWYLINPSASTADLVATHAASQDSGSGGVKWSVFVLGGVHQTSPVGATNTSTTNTNSPSVSVTSTAADGIIVGGFSNGGSINTPSGAGTPQVDTLLNGSLSCADGHSYKPTTTTGSYGLSWTTDTASRVNCCVAEFVPAAGGGGATLASRMSLLGVGL